MIVRLDRVVFDHGIGPATTRALHIRKDGSTAAPSDVGAYALAPTKGQQLTVVAEFTFQNQPGVALPPTLEIRARAVSPERGVLGHVAQGVVPVPAGGGASGPMLFKLSSPKLHQKGVGKYDVSWQWQFRLPASTWVSFGRSDHVVYVTLDVPGSPWTQATGAISQRRWPWTRVLDWACQRASGVTLASGLDAASKKIATKVEGGIYNLGEQEVLTYGGGGSFIEATSAGVFKATKLVQILEGATGPTPIHIYCTECAVAVTVLTNCLGGDLTLLKILTENPHGVKKRVEVNRIVKIGERLSTSPPFSYHEVAIRKATSGAKQVFDACLEPDWDTDLGDKVNDFRLTQGRRLGALTLNRTGTTFLQRLLEPDKELWNQLVVVAGVMPCLDSCDGAGPPADPIVEKLQQDFRQQIDAVSPPISIDYPLPDVIMPIAVAGFRVYDRVDNPSQLVALGPLVSASAGFAYVASRNTRSGATRRPDQRFRISVAWSQTADQAREALAWLMTRNDQPLALVKGADQRKVGDAVFATPGQRVAYLVQGNVSARIVSIGQTPVATGPIAEGVAANVRRGAPRSQK